ncbi:hypothetical protein QTP88_014704 [Uroleucon formosanum]
MVSLSSFSKQYISRLNNLYQKTTKFALNNNDNTRPNTRNFRNKNWLFIKHDSGCINFFKSLKFEFSDDFICDVYCTYQEIILWEIQRHPETRQFSVVNNNYFYFVGGPRAAYMY